MNTVYLELISRWVHVGTAIVLLGGAVFSRFVLLPSAAELPEAEHEQLRAGVLRRWKKFVHGGIGLLLISGLYNTVLAMAKHRGEGAYHGLYGLKVLLALGMFFIASVMVGRSSLATKMRQNAKTWLGLLVLLGAGVVAISGYLRTAFPVKVPATTATADPSPRSE